MGIDVKRMAALANVRATNMTFEQKVAEIKRYVASKTGVTLTDPKGWAEHLIDILLIKKMKPPFRDVGKDGLRLI